MGKTIPAPFAILFDEKGGLTMDQLKVGSFIAALRHEAGLTQEALGQKLGVTNKTVSRWENGPRDGVVESL